MSVCSDKQYMLEALSLAEKGRGTTRPNPLVGAVIVKNDKVVGRGYHKKAGQPHAEIMALREAGSMAKEATLFLTLEPCCHTGRTGPCTDKIISSGIKRVVFAVYDPDPRVNGKGSRILRKAGIEVKNGLLKKEAVRQNDLFFGYYKSKNPYVILKIAQTLDGRIAASSGDSKWISSPKSLKFAHRLRSEVDAVLIGAGTLRKDNPQLTVRNFKGLNPYRIVVSNSFNFPSNNSMFKNNSDYKTIVAGDMKNASAFINKMKNNKLIYWDIASKNKQVNLEHLLDYANRFGIKTVLVEGGAALATQFLKQGLVDKCFFVTTPKILGTGINGINELGITEINKTIELSDIQYQQSGKDIIVSGYPVKGSKCLPV